MRLVAGREFSMIKLISFLFVSIVLLGCSSQHDFLRSELGSYRDYINIKGVIKNDVYISKSKKFPFSFAVPLLVHPGAEISDTYFKNGGRVSFSDDIGNLIRIDFVSKKGYFKENMTDSDIVKIMDYFMYKELYEPTKMNIKMISKSIIDDKMFVVFNFPHGSTMSSNGQRLNAIRGSLCFVKEDVVFMLTRQSSERLSGNRRYDDIQALKEELFHDFKGFEYKYN